MGSEKKSYLARWLFFLFILAIVGCKNVETDKPLIFCAASMSPVLGDTLEKMGLQAAIHLGGSSVLITQLESGVEPNLLLLADHKLVSQVDSKRILEQSVFASNQIVLVRAKSNTTLRKTADISQLENARVAVASPQAAPLGHYTEQALGTGDLRAERIVLKDASSVVSALKSGHTELGVVYLSDAARLDELEILHHFPEDSHDPIQYSVLLLKPESQAARAVYNQLTSASGLSILKENHFLEAPAGE